MLGYIYWLYIERFFFELNRAVYRLAIFICKYSAWVSSAQSLRKKKKTVNSMVAKDLKRYFVL